LVLTGNGYVSVGVITNNIVKSGVLLVGDCKEIETVLKLNKLYLDS